MSTDKLLILTRALLLTGWLVSGPAARADTAQADSPVFTLSTIDGTPGASAQADSASFILDTRPFWPPFLTGPFADSGVFALDTRGAVEHQQIWIVSQPANQSLQAGAVAQFNVVVQGMPPLSCQWRKNGVDIPGATAVTLTLNGVSGADSGGYSVVVRNAYGSVESNVATLAVLDDGARDAKLAQEQCKPLPVIGPEQNSLVVITHGYEAVGQYAAWIDQMADAIRNKLTAEGKVNWQVVPVHWEEAAWGIPELAVAGARIEGALYGAEFAQVHWQNVHLIGHSAGSVFIEAFAKEIKAIWPDTLVHCTYLDPYLSAIPGLGVITYGENADWADSYFSDDWTGPFTGGKLEHAYNVDVTWLDPDVKKAPVYCTSQSSTGGSTPPMFLQCGVRGYSPGLTAGHSWPYEFYTLTITEEFTCAADMGLPSIGYGLSQEANGWNKHSGLGPNNDPVMLCPPPDAAPSTQPPLPNWTWGSLPLQVSPHAASGTWEFNGSSSFNLSATAGGQGPMQGNPGGHGVARQDASSTNATVSWFAVAVGVTNFVNYVQFDASFTSPTNAEGLMTVYWNTNQIGLADERVADPGMQLYQLVLPATVTNGLYTLSFRLDAFNGTSSSVTVTNVTTGFRGLMEAPVLSAAGTNTNGVQVLQLTATAGFDCVLLQSTNLVNWTPAAVLVTTNGTAFYPVPTEATSRPQFYRAMIP